MFLICTEEHLAVCLPFALAVYLNLLSQPGDFFEDSLFLRVDPLQVSYGLLVVLHTRVDWHGDGLGSPDECQPVTWVESEDLVSRWQSIGVVLLPEQTGHDVVQHEHFMLADPLVFLLVFALELFLGQLSVIDTLSVPLGIIRLEVSPHAVGFLVLAARRAMVASEVALVSVFHNQLEREQAWIV